MEKVKVIEFLSQQYQATTDEKEKEVILRFVKEIFCK
jgi:hypothetical protein